MTKKIIGAAVAAVMLMAVPCYAQTTTLSEKSKVRTEKMVKRDRTECTPRGCEFEGLDLTDAQKSQLRELNANRHSKMKARKDSAKVARQEAKAQARADRKAMKEQREAERRAYLQQVKKILGNEKYIMFLENQYVQEAGRPGPAVKAGNKVHRPAKEMKLRSNRKEMKGRQ